MTGFDASWLDLREAADHRARNRALLDAVAMRFGGRSAVGIVDLGCGTGSNLRALAPRLPAGQRWTLVDHDPKLLSAARARVAAAGGPAASFRVSDLSADVEHALGAQPDLVTAAALFDLVSTTFIERFADAVAARGATFYTALTYDGREAWDPPHALDGAMHAAFLAHQRRDKGFGGAAGPAAPNALVAAFLARGYRVATGESSWVLGGDDADLITALAAGVADAVRVTGDVSEADVAAWLAARRAATCTIGHQDLLALPPA